MPTRVQGRVDSGRRELGARVQNYHQPSADREGDATPATDTPASILLTISIPPPVTLSVGSTYQSTAVVYNTVGNVIAGAVPDHWFSSSPTIATVDGNGLVTGITGGTVSITASLGSVTSNALSITVVALPDTTVASVTVSPTTLTVQRFAPQTLSAVLKNAGGTALAVSPTSWTSSDPTKATVSSSGVVTWVAAGSTSVVAHYNAIASNACVVTTPAVVDTVAASVAISPTTLSLVTGAPQTLTAVVKNAAGAALALSPTSWTSSDTGKATVNSSGVVTWVAAGTTNITAHYNAITSNTCVVTALVDANTVAASVVVSPTTLTLQIGAPQTLNATIKNGSGVALALTPTSWTSSNTGVATVNSSGVVTWVAVGTTNVAAHYNALDSNNCVVTALVNPATVATSVAVSPTTLTLQSGAPQQLTAVIKNVSGVALPLTPTSWTSSAPSKATVNSSGLVTWVAAGTTNVAAHYNAIDSNNCAVTAVPVPDTTPASILIAPSTATIEEGRTQQLTALILNAAGGTLAGLSPSGWSSATPATCTVSSTGLVTGIAAGGPINVTATYLALTSNACAVTVSASSAGSQDLVTVDQPTLMTTTVASTPSAGSVISVANGGDFQAALNAAVPGDVIELAADAIVSAAGYNLPVLTGGIGGGWVTVRTAGTRPAEGVRVTEATATSNHYAKIRSTANNVPVISSHVATSHWRFMGVTIEVDPAVTTMSALVEMGVGGAPDTTTATLPDGVYFDRCVVRGHPSLDCRRAFALNGKSLAYFDCAVTEIHSVFDSQASSGWNGPGPFKIHNNLIEASTENIAFGGSDPAITGLNPENIEITRNHIRKPQEWKALGWLVKNLLELKKGIKVLIEGNVMENCWLGEQVGRAVVLWSVNQQSTDPTAECGHVTMSKNVIMGCASGFSLNRDGSNDLTAYSAVAMHHVAINNNVIIGLDAPPNTGGGRIFEINNQIEHLSIEHNTCFSPSNSSFIWGGHLPLTNHTVKNNLCGGGAYQLFTTAGQGQIAIDTAGASPFTGNVVVLAQGVPPATNDFPPLFSYLGLVGGASAAYDPTVTPAALALEPWSGYHHYGTDGTDPGADIAAVLAATSGVTSRW